MPTDRFLEEVRIQFENELRLKENLDDKASKIIAAAGTVAALLFGFGTFLLSSNNTMNYPEFFSQLVIATLMIGTATSIVAILFALLAYRLHKYRYALGHEPFYNKNSEEIEGSVINQFKTASTDNFEVHMIKEYLQSVKENAANNAKKARWITIAHWCFFGSVASPIVIIVPLFFIL